MIYIYMTDLCQFLQWDSDFFGYRIARTNTQRLDHEKMAQIRVWCEANTIDCLYFLADLEDTETTRIAESNGFRFTDIRLTFDLKRPSQIPTPEPDKRIRLSRPDDLNALRQTAQTAYTLSRFYADPCFSREKCGELYDIWLRRSFTEPHYAPATWIAEFDGQAVAYVTCHLNQETREGNIGLVGVSEAARGQQIGPKVVHQALAWFWEQDMKTVTVVTQGRNIAAQRLYQRCGFLTRSVELWYHLWLHDCDKTV